MSVRRFCDGCDTEVYGRKSDKEPPTYASVSLEGERKDLCFERCYAVYEEALMKEEQLAIRTEAEVVRARNKIWSDLRVRIRQSISEEKDGSPKVEFNHWGRLAG